MEVDDILKVDLKDPISVLSMPFPEFTAIERASHKELLQVIKKFLGIWKELLIDEVEIDIERYELADNQVPLAGILEGEEVWDYVFMLVTSYFDHSINRLLESEDQTPLPTGPIFESMEDFIPNKGDIGDLGPKSPKHFRLRVLSFHLLSLYFSLYMIASLTPAPLPPYILRNFERGFVIALAPMFEDVDAMKSKYLRIAASHLFANALEYAAKVYDKFALQGMTHEGGPFSAIRLPELSLLANRTAGICNRYGESKVARVFESQLALIAQSFGLYVISTRIGLNTVDLVCISSQPDERITFVIEAKTSKRAYYLPTRDARALRDYTSDLRSSLSSLPPLAFVLILGPGASSTLEEKLVALEAKVGVPIRFMAAQQFANLRELIPGPLPLRMFRQSILTNSRVLPDGIVDAIVDAYNTEQRAHSSFFESMIRAKGISHPYSRSASRV